MNKRKLLLFTMGFIIILSILSIGVNAQEAEKNPFRAIAKAFGGLNLGETYEEFPYFFDGVFLAIIFITIALMTLGTRFEGRPGKTLSVTVGLAMAVAFEAWNFAAGGGYTLRALGPYVALVLMVVAGIGLFYLLEKTHLSKPNSAIISIAIVYYLFKSMVPSAFDALAEKVPIFAAAIAVGEVVMWVAVIVLLFKGTRAVFGGMSAARQVEEDIIEAGGVKGIVGDIADRAKELARGRTNEDAELNSAIGSAKAGDQVGAKEALKKLGERVDLYIKGAKEARDDLLNQIAAFEKLPLTEKDKGKVNALVAIIDELNGKINELGAINSKVKEAAKAETVDIPTLNTLKGEINANPIDKILEKAKKKLEELQTNIIGVYKELDKEKDKVKKFLLYDADVMRRLKDAVSFDTMKNIYSRRIARLERREYRVMTKLIELLKAINHEKVAKIEALNNKLVKVLSAGGELNKLMKAEDKDKISKIAEDTFKDVNAAIILVNEI
jgi:hypothetical protein